MRDEDYADGIYNILKAVDYKLGGGYDFSTGIDYRNPVFQTQSFWAHADDEDYVTPGFQHFSSGLAVDWYKRVGRSTESNKNLTALEWYKIVVECIESVRDDE